MLAQESSRDTTRWVPKTGIRRAFRRHSVGYLFIAPAVLTTMIIMLVPLGRSLWLSFHSLSLIKRAPAEFVGLQNYIDTLSNPRFLETLRATLIFAVSAVTIEFVLGFLMALLLNREFRGQGLVRTAFLLPIFLTPVVVAMMWVQMFNPRHGLVNAVLGTQVGWLAHPTLAMVAVVVVDVWQQTPFMFMVLFAGLQSLPHEPHEAAAIDGASSWQTFRYVTLPLLKPLILVAILIRGMDACREFDKIYFLTGGGPGNITEVISMATWRSAFSHFEMGTASAMAYVLLIIIFALCAVFIKWLRDAQIES